MAWAERNNGCASPEHPAQQPEQEVSSWTRQVTKSIVPTVVGSCVDDADGRASQQGTEHEGQCRQETEREGPMDDDGVRRREPLDGAVGSGHHPSRALVLPHTPVGVRSIVGKVIGQTGSQYSKAKSCLQ